MRRRRWLKRSNRTVNQGSSGKQIGRESPNGGIDVAQLRRLIKIQTQVVTLAKQNEQAERRHKEMQRGLNGQRGFIRRLLQFLSTVVKRNSPPDSVL